MLIQNNNDTITCKLQTFIINMIIREQKEINFFKELYTETCFKLLRERTLLDHCLDNYDKIVANIWLIIVTLCCQCEKGIAGFMSLFG